MKDYNIYFLFLEFYYLKFIMISPIDLSVDEGNQLDRIIMRMFVEVVS